MPGDGIDAAGLICIIGCPASASRTAGLSITSKSSIGRAQGVPGIRGPLLGVALADMGYLLGVVEPIGGLPGVVAPHAGPW